MVASFTGKKPERCAYRQPQCFFYGLDVFRAKAYAFVWPWPEALRFGHPLEIHRMSDNTTTPLIDPGPSWKIRGPLRQSVAAWCFQPMKLETLARQAKAMGYESVELVEPPEWPILKKHGLINGMILSHGFVTGLNDVKHHERCLAILRERIDLASAAGFPNVITFSGMKKKIPDDLAKSNCVKALKKIVGHAEKRCVNLCIEVLNSRVDVEMKGHPGYQCDTIEWAAEVIDRVGSERVKILFDLYHTQIMQGDLTTRLRRYKDYIGHVHVAGVPGRNELDLPDQEINYPAVMRTLRQIGYKGLVGQEFIPTRRDKIAALRRAAYLCDV